eukprot:4927366-Pyramimonas_sp.AAC.1
MKCGHPALETCRRRRHVRAAENVDLREGGVDLARRLQPSKWGGAADKPLQLLERTDTAPQ